MPTKKPASANDIETLKKEVQDLLETVQHIHQIEKNQQDIQGFIAMLLIVWAFVQFFIHSFNHFSGK